MIETKRYQKALEQARKEALRRAKKEIKRYA
jgi:uncharacterized protein YbjQ (UPF0145 family)